MAKIEVGFLQLGTGCFFCSFWNSEGSSTSRLENRRNYNCMIVQIGSAAGSATNNYNL
jgi:hypothetical protein